jgi:iron complex outermembrane receptor protein
MRKFKLLLTGILLFSSLAMVAQQTVKGVVKDKATGETLPGVSIVVKGTTNGTSTDFDGNFELKNVKTGDILVFSYLGFTEKEVALASNFNLTIELEESAQRLDEIVVVGYGTTTVKDATGSVEAITAKDFTRGNIVTPENLLNGRVSGVTITQDGSPGSGGQIRIRGGSSISASNDPLIIIDGLPLDGEGVGGSRGLLSNINPNDIESFSILKDASATAIYGSRASNGVIIITTKKGKKGFSADLDLQYTSAETRNRVDVFSADEFRNLVNSQPVNGVTLNPSLLGNANTDWQDEIFRTAQQKIVNLTTRGAVFGIPTRLSLSNTVQEGVLITDKYRRSNASISINPTFFEDHFKVNINANYADDSSDFADGGQIGAALRYDPTQPVFDSTSPFGGFYQHRNGVVVANGTTNPVAQLRQRENVGDVERIFGNINLDYKMHFLPELRAVVNLGYDKQTSNTRDLRSVFNATTDADLLFEGEQRYSFQERVNTSFDGYFAYNKEFGDFTLDATVGYSYQKFENSGSFTGNLTDPNDIGDTFQDPDIVLIGYFGRANFGYKGKYLASLNYRRDGTSRFSSENRWGNFLGASAAWIISEEDFLKENEVISSLKLRASYGENGQQNLFGGGNNTLFLDRFRGGNPNSQIVIGGVVVNPAFPAGVSPDLKWEETSTLEVGIDYGLFDDRITGSVSAYRKNSADLLFPTPLAEGTNFTNQIVTNVGELETLGLEFAINADIIDKDDMNWSVNFNGSFIDREITELALGQDIRDGGIAGGTGNTIQLLSEGAAPRSFHVFKQLYDTAGNPIEGAFADLNGDGIINDDDRYLKENPDPDATFGFQSTFNYKNWDFAFNLRASIGNYVYNNVNSSGAQYELLLDNSVLGNIPTSVLETNFQRTADVIISDIYLENASFLRMDNITLGYTFQNPAKGFKSVRLWTGMQNVFVLTEYSGLDPEVFNGIDNTIYPRPRTILFGANIKF